MLQMIGKNKSELVKQIEAYGLKSKLAALAHKEQAKRPFQHLPKQFSKGILIGNIAIVPRKWTMLKKLMRKVFLITIKL